MKTMGIHYFKSGALKIIDQVTKTREIIVITKRGKPLAQISPYRAPDINPEPGRLSDALVFEKDIISPLGEEMWEVCECYRSNSAGEKCHDTHKRRKDSRL